MSFAKFSSDFLMNNYTLVDNMFILELLPNLDAAEIKIYLYGQYLCMNQTKDNSLEEMAKTLSVSPNTILTAYQFFEDNGLVHIISKDPLEVEYLCLKNQHQLPKKFKADKYTDFSKHLQTLFPTRMLTPNEYNEYIGFLESSGMSQDALLMVVQYSIDLKGDTVRYPYILAIARNWASEGVKTIDDVEQKLQTFETQSELMREVLKSLNRKGGADLEEKQMLTNWTKTLGFEDSAIIYAAKSSKSKTFKNLDNKLNEFYRLSIFTKEQMQDYNKHKETLRNIAVTVNSKLGVYYEVLDPEIETYIVPWTEMGYTDIALETIAKYCFTSGVKNLDGMNTIINNLYSAGIISVDAINEYVSSFVEMGIKIKKILEASGTARNVTAADRSYYSNWTRNWGYTDDIILYAAELSCGKMYAMSYINQLLSKWKNMGVETLEDAKKAGIIQVNTTATPIQQRDYTAEELKGIFGNSDISDSDI